MKLKKKSYDIKLTTLFLIYIFYKTFFQKNVIVLNYSRTVKIDDLQQNVLVWSVESSLKNYNIKIIDFYGIKSVSKNIINISYLAKLADL